MSRKKGVEGVSMRQYLQKTRSYLWNMISNFKKSDEQKNQLTMKPKFMSSKDSIEKRTMHARSDNVETIQM